MLCIICNLNDGGQVSEYKPNKEVGLECEELVSKVFFYYFFYETEDLKKITLELF